MIRSPVVIVAARVLAGLSQEELADAAGIPLGTLKNLEQGRADPRHSTVLALIDTLAKRGVRFMMESDRIAWGVYVERDSEAVKRAAVSFPISKDSSVDPLNTDEASSKSRGVKPTVRKAP